MFTQNLVIFLIITIVGFFITFIGVKNKHEYRRYIITAGIAVLHVGIFGILYDKLSFTPFLALVLLVLSTFILIDPLKIAKNFPPRSFRTFGLLLLIASLAFALMFITGFPVWLWIFPFVIYVMPYTIPSWRAKHRIFQAVAWLLIFLYASIISYHIYTLYHPETKVSFLESILSPLSNKNELQAKLKFFENNSVTKVDMNQMLSENAQDTPPESDSFDLMTNPLNSTEKITPSVTDTTPSETLAINATPTDENQTKEIAKEKPEPEKTPPTGQTQTNAFTTPTEVEGPLLQAVKEFDQKYLELKMNYRKLQDKYREALREIEELKKKTEEISE